MDEIRLLTKRERKLAYDTVFREAFPPEELKPLAAMEHMITAGCYEVRAMLSNGLPVCYFCNWFSAGFVLIDYFCVPRAMRSGGIGSRAMPLMMRQYPQGTVFVAETEAETGDPAKDEMICRRQELYRRLGGTFLPYDCALFGVHYRTVVWAEGQVDAAEVLRQHDGLYRRSFSAERYAAAVQLPLRPGEQPFPKTPWRERPEEETEECEDEVL